MVDGGAADAANEPRFAANSLLVEAGVKGGAPLPGNGSGPLEVDSGAGFLLTVAQPGNDVTIADDFADASIAPGGWTQNLKTDTPLPGAAGEEVATGKYVVHVKSNGSASGRLPGPLFRTRSRGGFRSRHREVGSSIHGPGRTVSLSRRQ